MKGIKNTVKGIAAISAMLIIIFDAKTALQGTSEGLTLCLQTIIPSLFPFFVLSSILNSLLIGCNVPFFRPLCKHCGIPDGCESLFLLGLIAGYPIGAQLITQAYEDQAISKTTAHRMLGFCNNAGPAFIFGILHPLFSKIYYIWFIWGIQIISALLVGLLLPLKNPVSGELPSVKPVNIAIALQKGIKSIATVCGWIIIFRMIISFSEKWFLWLLPTPISVIYSGLLELSNGVLQLHSIASESIRFILANGMLAAGGLCVGLQTCSVTKTLGTGYYFPGKVLQSLLCCLISMFMQNYLFKESDVTFMQPYWYIIIFICSFIILYFLRKRVAFQK